MLLNLQTEALNLLPKKSVPQMPLDINQSHITGYPFKPPYPIEKYHITGPDKIELCTPFYPTQTSIVPGKVVEITLTSVIIASIIMQVVTVYETLFNRYNLRIGNSLC